MDRKLLRFITFFSYIGFYVGLAFLLAFNMSELTRLYSVPIRLLLSLLMVVFIVYHGTRTRPTNDWKNENFIYIFWIIYLAKAYFDMLDPDISYSKKPIEYFAYTVLYCVLPFFMFKSIDLRKYRALVVDSIILSGFVMGLASMFLYKEIIMSGNIGRINQAHYLGFDIITINPLILSYTSSLTLGLIFFKFGDGEQKSILKKIYYVITILLSIILLLLGSSRGAIIALGFSLLILFVFGNLRLKRRILLILLATSPVILYGIYKIGSSIVGRMTTVSNLEDDNSASTRMEYWKESFNEFLNYPLLGGRLEVSGIYPHNIFVEILMSTGVIGLLSFIFFLFYCFFKAYKVCKSKPEYIWIALFFVQAVIHYNFTESIYLANALFISAGLICSPTFNKESNEIS